MTVFVAEGSQTGTFDLIADLGFRPADDPSASQVCVAGFGSTGLKQVPPEHKVVVIAEAPADALLLTSALAPAKRRFVVVAGSSDEGSFRRRLRTAIQAAHIAAGAAVALPVPGPTGETTPAGKRLNAAATSAGLYTRAVTLAATDWDGGAMYLGASAAAPAEGATDIPFGHAFFVTITPGPEKPRLAAAACEVFARGVPGPPEAGPGGWARPAAGLVTLVESLARLGAGNGGILIYGVRAEFFLWLSRLMDAELSMIKDD